MLLRGRAGITCLVGLRDVFPTIFEDVNVIYKMLWTPETPSLAHHYRPVIKSLFSTVTLLV